MTRSRNPGSPTSGARRRWLLAAASATTVAALVLAGIVTPAALAALRAHVAAVPAPTRSVATVYSPTGQPQPLTGAGVVGLGDSVPAGTACACTSYVTLVAKQLATRFDRSVPVTNFAVNGQTSSGLLDQLTQPATRRALAQASVVIVTIGANDFDADEVADGACSRPDSAGCFGADLAALRSHLDAILARVHAAVPPVSRVLVTGYWNVFLDGDVGSAKGASYVTNSDTLTRKVNAAVAAAAARAGDTYVDLYAPFKGDGSRDDTRLLAADGDHPSAAGHQVIAAALADALG